MSIVAFNRLLRETRTNLKRLYVLGDCMLTRDRKNISRKAHDLVYLSERVLTLAKFKKGQKPPSEKRGLRKANSVPKADGRHSRYSKFK